MAAAADLINTLSLKRATVEAKKKVIIYEFYVYCTLPRDYLLFFWQVGVFSKGMIKL